MGRLIFHILIICKIIYTESFKVQTTLGEVEGILVHDNLTNTSYRAFLGIPYAESPAGKRRFQAPVRKSAWHTTFPATKPGYVCPQTELFHLKEEMNEDCLTFNIYTPEDYENKSFPVIFSIHSGDFCLQSGKHKPIYDPTLLIQQKMVVATINYRLGALGFLSLDNEKLPGNAGVKDVVLALKIVFENISRFGGDPNKITIRGSGAGAVIGQMIMLTNECVGVVHNAMFHCGSILSPKFMQNNPRENAMSLVHELGIEWTNDDDLMEKLKYVDAFDIIDAQDIISKKDPRRGFRLYRPFKPVVETENPSSVLTRQPVDLLKEGAICDVPVYMGVNDQEGLEMWPLLQAEPELIDKMNENFEQAIPEDIDYPKGSVARSNMAKEIKDFYFGGKNISFDNIKNYFHMESDMQYIFSIDRFVKLFKEKIKSNIYYYVFNSDTPLNWFKAFANITFPGAAHDDNLGYVFITSVTRDRYKDLDDVTKRAQQNILKNIRYFSIFGEPPANPSPWPDAGPKGYHTVLNNTGATTVFHGPYPERIGFWDSAYKQYQASKNSQNPPLLNLEISVNTSGLIPTILGLLNLG